MIVLVRPRLGALAMLALPFAVAWVCSPRLTFEQFDLPKYAGLALLLMTWAGGADLRGVAAGVAQSPPVIMFLAAAIISAALAPAWSAAWLGDRENLTGVLTFVMHTGCFAVGLSLSRAGMRRWGTALLVAACGSAAYALGQLAGWDPFRGEYFRHVRAAAGNPDFFAQQLAIALPFALTTAFCGAGVWRFGLAAVFLTVLGLTGSRAGLVAGFLATGWLIRRQRRSGQWPASRLRLAGGLALAALVAAEWFIAPEISLRARLASLASGQGLTASRGAVWQGAAAAATVRPLLGWGPDQLGPVFLAYAPAGWASREGLGETARNAHCEFLHLLATGGVAGLGAWLWLLALTWARFQHRSGHPADDAVAAGLLAYVLQNTFSFGSATTAPVAWVLLGWLNRPSTETTSATAPRSVPLPFMVAAGVAIFFGVRLMADAWAFRGNEADRAGRTAACVASFDTASRLAPWEPAYLVRGAYALEQLSRVSEALPLYERAASLRPVDGITLGHVGRVRFAQATLAHDAAGQRAALDVLVQAVDLAPSQPSLYGAALNASQSLGELAIRDRLLAQLAIRDPGWYSKMVSGGRN